MTLLNILAIASFVFVVAFTWRACVVTPGVGQSPRSAIFEAWTNLAIGFAVNYLANWFILPMIGTHVTADGNFAIGWIYVAISMLRQFFIRRFFNAKIHAWAQKVA